MNSRPTRGIILVIKLMSDIDFVISKLERLLEITGIGLMLRKDVLYGRYYVHE